MSAYAAMARIERVSPRLVPAELRLETDPPWSRDAESPPTMILLQADDVLPGPAPTLPERWAAARERWGQLTFYLFDPQSWR